MKRIIVFLLMCVTTLASAIALSGCTLANITEISIEKMPDKISYFEGESFDKTGMIVKASYDDGTSADVTTYTVDKDVLSLTDTKVIVTYARKTAEVLITVLPIEKQLTSLEVATQPTKLAYIEGESFDKTGMVINAVFDDASKEAITAYTVDKTTLTKEDTKVVVSYQGKEVEVSITVSPAPKQLSSLEVATQPTKLAYFEGESFDKAGMVINAVFDDASKEAVTTYAVDKTTLSKEDTKVVVSYQGKEVEVSITVNAIELSHLLVNVNPTKTSYKVGEYFDKFGMEIKAVKNNGSSETITDYTVDKTKLALGDDKVVVSYQNKQVEVAISVADLARVTDNFDIYGNSGPVNGINNTPDFEVVNDGTNGYLHSLKSEWGGSPWYGLNVGDLNLCDNYEVSFDIMFPTGVYGIGCVQLGGIVAGNPYEIIGIQLNADGSHLLYANGNGGQLYNSTDLNLGGTGNEWELTQNKWAHYRFVKLEDQVFIYVNDVLVVNTVIKFEYTKILGVAFVQFLFDGTSGIVYDNLVIQEVLPVQYELNTANQVTDNFDSYGNSGPVNGIANTPDFEVLNDGTNGYLHSLKSEWGGTPWFGLNVSELNLVTSYAVEFDFKYPGTTNGIMGFQIGGAVNGGAFEIGCVHYRADGTFNIYANGPSGQIINSTEPTLGGTGNTVSLDHENWHTFKMEKIDKHINMYIDGVKLVSIDIQFNFTKLLGVAFIQFLENGTTGICYDNLVITEIVIK